LGKIQHLKNNIISVEVAICKTLKAKRLILPSIVLVWFDICSFIHVHTSIFIPSDILYLRSKLVKIKLMAIDFFGEKINLN
jgi:hypothetical protein